MAKRRSSSSDSPGITDLDGDPGSPVLTDIPAKDETAPAPAPDPEKKSEEKSEEAKAGPPKPVVPLRVWLGISGVKRDRLAGFIKYATREEMRPCPVLEWRSRYEAFMNKPTKSLRQR